MPPLLNRINGFTHLTLINTFKNQEDHHRKLTFEEVYIAILKRHNIQFENHA